MHDRACFYGQRIRERVTVQPLLMGCALALLLFPNALLGALTLYPVRQEWPNVVLAVGFTFPLVFLFTKPELTVLLALPAHAVQLALSDSLTFGNVVPLLAMCAIAVKRPWRSALFWTVAVTLAFTVHTWLRWNFWWRGEDAHPRQVSLIDVLTAPFPEFFVAAVPVCCAMLTGRVIRMQRQTITMERLRAAQLERDRQLAAELAVAHERSRIAADVHDILAHSLAVIAVQTDAATLLLGNNSENGDSISAGSDLVAACTAVETAHGAAVQALHDTRALARAIDSPSVDAAPQPTLDQLPDLVRSCDPAQKRFALRSSVDLAALDVPSTVGLAVYRIVQEALTNVMRHAPADAQARVMVSEDAGNLSVEIVDDGAPPPREPTRGRGVINMEQRARSVGGTLEVGPYPEGGFRVRALVPLATKSCAS